MKIQFGAVAIIITSLAFGFGAAQGQQRSSLIGDWTGESICVGDNRQVDDQDR